MQNITGIWRGKKIAVTRFDSDQEKGEHAAALSSYSDALIDAMMDGPKIDADLWRKFIELNYVIEKLIRLSGTDWDFPGWIDLFHGVGNHQGDIPGIEYFLPWFMRRFYSRLLGSVIDDEQRGAA